jgi:hypothetical protein
VRKFNISSKTYSIDEMQEYLDNPNTKVQTLTLEFKNPNPNRANDPVTSEGWGKDIPILNSLWRQAKDAKAGFVRCSFLQAKTAELWSCQIVMWSPGYYEGWRKYSHKLAMWIDSL